MKISEFDPNSNRDMQLLYGTIIAKKNRDLLDQAEEIINSWLAKEPNTVKHLYMVNADGSMIEIKPGIKLLEYGISISNDTSVKRTLDNCPLIKKMGSKPNQYDGKCEGYAGDTDETCEKCKECELNVYYEDD